MRCELDTYHANWIHIHINMLNPAPRWPSRPAKHDSDAKLSFRKPLLKLKAHPSRVNGWPLCRPITSSWHSDFRSNCSAPLPGISRWLFELIPNH